MDLKEYLYQKRMTIKEFSEQMECSRPYLSRIIHGKKKPSKRLAKDIERLTNGEVKAEELLGDKESGNELE